MERLNNAFVESAKGKGIEVTHEEIEAALARLPEWRKRYTYTEAYRQMRFWLTLEKSLGEEKNET